MLPRRLAVSSEPAIATPSAWPTCRLVEAMPDATPACPAGMPDTAALVIWPLTMPTPTPKSTNIISTCPLPVAVLSCDIAAALRVSAAPPSISGTRALPRLPAIRVASGGQTAMAAAAGSMRTAACSADRPRPSCRYRVLRKRKPPRHANVHRPLTAEPANGRLPKNRGSISGSSRRSSQATRRHSVTAASANRPRISADRQPTPGPSMIAYVSDPSMTITSTWPTGSCLRGRDARDSGTNSAVSTMAASPTGTLTQKIQRQPTEPTSTPPSTGPRAMATPNTLTHTPIARARCAWSVNVAEMIETATGLSIDPPTACSTRKPTSQPSDGATPHSAEPMEKTASPIWKTRRRPIRSAVDPANMSRVASGSVKASTVHCRPDTGVCSPLPMAGRAMFTIVFSSPMMNRLRQQMARTSTRRRRLSSGKDHLTTPRVIKLRALARSLHSLTGQ